MVSHDSKSLYHLNRGRRDGALMVARLLRISDRTLCKMAIAYARTWHHEVLYYKRAMRS